MICLDPNEKIALVCYQYGIEVSPTLKNICSYLYDNGADFVDIFTDYLSVDSSFVCYGARIFAVGPKPLRINGLNRWREYIRSLRFAFAIKKRLDSYRVVFAVDFQSLIILRMIGYDFSKVVFLSLEGVDALFGYRKALVWRLLERCKLCVIQSEERARDFTDYLEHDVKFAWLPVSQRPQAVIDRPRMTPPRMLYTGYFSEWACLLELLESYNASRVWEVAPLFLQGHFVGTDSYRKLVCEAAATIKEVTVDNSYYDDESHRALIGKHDIGIAFYKNATGTSNFRNLIRSSGKICSYLWNGLPVITNIDCDETRKPPFVYVDILNEGNLKAAVQQIIEKRKMYELAAYNEAKNTYNFDSYFGTIVSKLFR